MVALVIEVLVILAGWLLPSTLIDLYLSFTTEAICRQSLSHNDTQAALPELISILLRVYERTSYYSTDRRCPWSHPPAIETD